LIPSRTHRCKESGLEPYSAPKEPKVVLAVLAEEETVYTRAELLTSEVARCEGSATLMLIVWAVDLLEESSLANAELEGAGVVSKGLGEPT
jgi:hypothetical protein